LSSRTMRRRYVAKKGKAEKDLSIQCTWEQKQNASARNRTANLRISMCGYECDALAIKPQRQGLNFGPTFPNINHFTYQTRPQLHSARCVIFQRKFYATAESPCLMPTATHLQPAPYPSTFLIPSASPSSFASSKSASPCGNSRCNRQIGAASASTSSSPP
jgi:hypothetical protein